MSVTINFHPDIRVGNDLVIEHLARDGVYRSQFETGTSSGGLTAFRGGDRWKWESDFFRGAYDLADHSLRPKYGALNFQYLDFGASPRFGSCHLRLRPHILARTTFCYPESHFGPEAFGVADRLALIELARTNPRNLDPLLDNYIEAHLHGILRLHEDVEAIVLDHSYRGTVVELAAAASGCKLEWHDGFRLKRPRLLENLDFRPKAAIEAIQDLNISTPADIGTVRGKQLDYQTAKWVWHCVARFGWGD